MVLLRQLYGLLTARQRRQAALLLAALVIRAGFELVGVAGVAPFMSVAADPSVIHRNPVLRTAYAFTGVTSDTAFLLVLGVAMIVLLAVSNAFSAFSTWILLRFVWSANHQLSMRLLRGYLAQPYSFFVQRNSASLNKTILSEVTAVINGVLMPTMNVIAQVLVVAALGIMLLVVDPLVATGVVVVLGGLYGSLYMVIRRRQGQLGRVRVDANQLRYKVAGEAFGGIKDVKVLQREQAFLDRFAPPSRRFSLAMASNGAITLVPRYLLETIAFGGILGIVLYYVQAGRAVSQILPIISLYAVAGYRLMPALQILFASVAGVRFNHAALDDLCADLDRFRDASSGVSSDTPLGGPAGERLPFAEAIHFDDVAFRYPQAAAPALRGLSLTVRRNETIGLVGPSGSGKTTLVDLLLGLYVPDGGRILVDDRPLDERTTAAWRRQIGYVPQQIFLSDDSIARNIAFGIPAKEVDLDRVVYASRIAHLHEFVASMPEGYDTLVGERGVRLSGGQRQRIGIARALYHDPDVLIMDEATSALDGVTEDAVMEAIQELSGKKTVIIIAHRLTTVQSAHRIFLIEGGQVTDAGTFEQLTSGNATFRAMAKMRLAASA